MELVPSVSAQNPLVRIRNAFKSYGYKKDTEYVLKNLNMTVYKGVIYGLLGSSGCGKTTLLNCMLGQKVLNSGNVWILGGAPNTKESKVPGPSVGYMPQSVGVQPEFTSRETMYYFGSIAGMSSKVIEEKISFLKELLLLPDLNITIGDLSGGEKRRVSFAVALIHEPELLILDEPTVGLDPVLRANIWSYLYDLTTTNQATVILTTHYIDEARHANIVGLLRDGKMIAEESPDNLLRRLEVSTLEDAFYMLSSSGIDEEESNEHSEDNVRLEKIDHQKIIFSKNSSIHHLKPLLYKNYKWLVKNPTLVTMMAIIPVVQLFLFYFAIGHDPVNLNLAVVNDETSLRSCSPLMCNSTTLSCNFLQYLQEANFNLTYYDKEEEAIRSVLRGSSYSSVYLRHNYSLALKKRIDLGARLNWDLVYSNIDVYRDVSDYNIAMFLRKQFIDCFQSFLKDYLKSCDYNENITSLPMKFNEPIHGKSLPDFTEFAVPALIISALCFYSAWATASALLTDLNNGVIERNLVMGVEPIYLLFAHTISESLLMIIHLVTVFMCAFLVMNFSLEGSIVLIIITNVLIGFCGMSFGFALSCICTTDAVATYVILGCFFPAGALSGVIWPVEGMPVYIQKVALILPFAGAAEAMRSVMQRGWGIMYPQIYLSYVTTTAWTLLFVFISIYSLKYRKR